MSQLVPEPKRRPPERWDPFDELDLATTRVRRLLEQTFGGLGWPGQGESRGWTPLVDVVERDDAYVVEAELPGVRREDVQVELAGDELAISGEIGEHEPEGRVHRKTRRTGRFDYRVALPGGTDADRVEAKLTDGVLTVRVPRSEQTSRRTIEVTS